jgi:protein-S-isoprenylcysteine O-methyltransferase Ste14
VDNFFRGLLLSSKLQFMLALLQTFGWMICVIYSTIPTFWLLIHPRAQFWRSRPASPYKILLPLWIGMWAAVAAITAPWHGFILYTSRRMWFPATALFCAGLILYRLSRTNFSLAQLGGLPEVLPDHSHQRLVTTGIRAYVRHPVYLGHLCQMLAWSVGTGLAVCWVLTSLTMISGAIMIKMEDEELEKRFGEEYKEYRRNVPAVFFSGRRPA